MGNICFLGDSITKGVALDADRGRYTILKDCFANTAAKYWSMGVKNLSKFGSTVTDGLHRFRKQKDDLVDCQTVIMDFGGNDSDFNWSAISETPDAQHDPKTGLDVFEDTYMELIKAVREEGKKPVLMNLPPVDHKKYFSWISRGLNGENILRWLGGSSEYIYRWHERYSIAVQSVAKKANVKLLDVRSAFLERRDYTWFLCEDGIHHNAQGHALIADVMKGCSNNE